MKKLEESGGHPICGIIDYDNANIGTKLIHILGGRRRYAIENYLLDPIFIALGLIRHGKKRFSDFSIQSKSVYIEGDALTEAELQSIVDSILNSLGLNTGSKSPVKLENGFDLIYPDAFLMLHGHTYEVKLLEKIPELNAIKRGRDDGALKEQMLHVICDFPQFLPIDVCETLRPILAGKKRLED
ncbi:hypothetical protein [Roseateles sp. LKC17W]|uniref:Uncharacterized protein n=1 Tax=Pelomonas margarita TaxID=3299031 RepID=A0ABW7FFI0_9BURK